MGAEQFAVLPPCRPAQVHENGPVPLTELALPLLHKPVSGAVSHAVWVAGPQAPLTGVRTITGPDVGTKVPPDKVGVGETVLLVSLLLELFDPVELPVLLPVEPF